MAHDDSTLETALWLAAGGAAGYVAGRFIVDRRPPMRPNATAPASVPPTKTSAPIAGTAAPIATPTAASTDGPITHPSQITGIRSASSFATSERVRRFDAVFERYRGPLPLEYVRALVERESDGLPDARTGSAIGLLQIVPVVLDDYNKRHGTAYTSVHLTDPAINVALGCELLRLIVASYRRNHPRLPALQADWSNPNFVELLTFGWNAGFSEAGGVGRVASYVERLGNVDITIDQVSAQARPAGASTHLSNPAKVAWCKSVAALYRRERELRRPLASS